jgi:GDPmannose 4,6-dehydratase
VKTSLVVGAGGQDGTLLCELLRRRGDQVIGVDYRKPSVEEVIWDQTDILQRDQVLTMMGRVKPDECYYLAAYHHSAEDAELQSGDAVLFEKSYAVHVQGLIHFLDAIAKRSPATRLFYAASSHVFGSPAEQPQTEATPMNPENIYGITKAAGIHCCRFFRREHHLFASVGILYNHESHLRPPTFLSQKIVRGVLAFKADATKKFALGDLTATVDWGYAPDYVEAMARILGQAAPDDFIVATGVPHTVGDFLQTACELAGVDWRQCASSKPGLLKKKSVLLTGDSSKLRKVTGWQPGVSFRGMIEKLLEKAGQRDDKTTGLQDC